MRIRGGGQTQGEGVSKGVSDCMKIGEYGEWEGEGESKRIQIERRGEHRGRG